MRGWRMRSRFFAGRLAFLPALLVPALFVASCSLKMNEPTPQKGGLGMAGADTGCLSKAFDTWQEFFEGHGDDAKIARLCDCASGALKLFAERTRGAKQGEFSPGELRDFLQRYFLGELKIPDNFVSETMHFKRALLGGSHGLLTVAEISRARELIGVVKEQLIKIRPFMPLSPSMIEAAKGREGFLEAVINAIVGFGETAGGALQGSGEPYSLSRFEGFLDALERLYKGSGPGTLKSRMPLIRALKEVLIGPGDEISGGDWTRVLGHGARWYGVLLRYTYLNANHDSWTAGSGGEQLSRITKEMRDLLSDSAARHPGGGISIVVFENLIGSARKEIASSFGFAPDALARLLAPAFELKSALFGGADGLLGPADIKRIYEVFEALKPHYAPVKKYYDLELLNPRKLRKARVRQRVARELVKTVSDAGTALALAVKRPGGRAYSLAQFGTMLSGLKELAGKSILLETVIEHLELVGAMKSVIVGPPYDTMNPADWHRLAAAATRWYALGLRYFHFVDRHESWSLGSAREEFFDIVSQARGLLLESVSLHPGRTIVFEELDRLVDAFKAIELPARKETLRALVRAAVYRSFAGSGRGPEGRDAGGLTAGLVNRVWTAFERWAGGQRYLEGLFTLLVEREFDSFNSSADTAFLDEQLLAIEPQEAYSYFGPLDALTHETAADLRTAIKVRAPMLAGNRGEISFNPDVTGGRHTLQDLSDLNWIRQMGILLIAGYAGDPVRGAPGGIGVTFEEFKNLTDDVRNLGIDLKFIDPTRYDMHYKRFRESNLFGYSSDGNYHVSLNEATDLLSLMVSAKKLAMRIHNTFKTEKPCELGPLDPFDFEYINDIGCFRREFFKRYSVSGFMKQMAGAVDQYRSLDNKKRRHFEYVLEDASRLYGYSSKPMDSTDIEGIAMVSHYVEVILQRFDKDRSGTLNLKEGREAFKIFKRQFADYVRPLGIKSDKMIEALFMYLLAHGKAPGKTAFVGWLMKRPFWSFEADRSRIYMIFSEISRIK